MPCTIVACTKASHELPSAKCKAARGPSTADSNPPGTNTHLVVISNFSLIIVAMNHPQQGYLSSTSMSVCVVLIDEPHPIKWFISLVNITDTVSGKQSSGVLHGRWQHGGLFPL